MFNFYRIISLLSMFFACFMSWKHEYVAAIYNMLWVFLFEFHMFQMNLFGGEQEEE